MQKLISLVIPVYNEEGNIERLINSLNEQLPSDVYDFEYILVNDGSKDNSFNVLKEFTDDSHVKIINFSRNFGKEAAILAGLDHAKGDASIIIDADLQMPISYIDEMLMFWQEGYKLVLTYKTNRDKGLKNKMASKYYDVFNKLSDHHIIKDALDFQLMDKSVVKTIVCMRERNRFLKGITGFIGYNYKIIPVEIVERESGKSSFGNFSTLFSYAFKSFVIHSNVPLKISIITGSIISFVSFLYLIYIIVNTLIGNTAGSGYASLMCVTLFMFGIVLLFLGIIGYYVGFIYDEVKARPNYIIEDKINFED